MYKLNTGAKPDTPPGGWGTAIGESAKLIAGVRKSANLHPRRLGENHALNMVVRRCVNLMFIVFCQHNLVCSRTETKKKRISLYV